MSIPHIAQPRRPEAQPVTAAQMPRTISVYMRSSAATAFAGMRCLVRQYSFHGSTRSRESRAGTVLTVNRSGVRAGDSSVQASGTDTGASGFARVEYAAID